MATKNIISKGGVFKKAPMPESSGGGPLAVHITIDDSTGASTLDKTWQEIKDADAVSVVFDNAGENERVFLFCLSVFERVPLGGGDTQYVVKVNSLRDSEIVDFIASSASGYPSYAEDVEESPGLGPILDG